MIILTDENFDKEIKNSGKPVLVDFWADWCHPCKIMGPILEKIGEELKEKLIFAKINVDSAPISAQKHQIEQIPTVLLFKNGETIDGFVGVQSEEIVKEWLKKNL